MLQHGAGALFFDPGLRKTSTTLAALSLRIEKGLTEKVLIIAPLRVCYNVWPDEIQKWKDFNHLTYTILHGPDKEERLDDDVNIYLINPEGLEWLLGVTKTRFNSGKVAVAIDTKRWKRMDFDALVIDELTKFKNHQAIRFKAMKQVLNTFRIRWGLTGSPAANGLMGLWAQCYMLDLGNALGPYITKYRFEYFVPHASGFGWVLQNGADKRIFKRVKPLALRLEDPTLVPKLVENHIVVTLPDKAMQVYKKMEKDLVAYLESGEKISAAAAGAKFGKCRQLASGGVFIDQDVLALVRLPKSHSEWANIHQAKTEAILELIEELQGNPLLIAYEYHHDLERLQVALKDLPVMTSNQKQATKVIAQWNSGELPYLALQSAGGCHGLNLQGSAQHVCFYSPTPDYEVTDQFIRRVRRSGNKHKTIFAHFIVAKDTVDQKLIIPHLKARKTGQESLFQALRGYKRSQD